MRALAFSLIAGALVACSDDKGMSYDYDCYPEWPNLCAPAKLVLSCAPFQPPPEAPCPDQLYPLIFWALSEAAYLFMAEELIASDFRFVDETTGESTQGQAYERVLADSLMCYYLSGSVEFDFQITSRTEEGTCEKACGMVFMRLYRAPEAGLIVNDQTCMMVCPSKDGLWRLTEWRILRSVPPAQDEKGFEGVTWGEARKWKWEEAFCLP